MLFSENERRELAEFFAKRFSDDAVRTMLAQQAGIETTENKGEATIAWEALITTAQNRRRLPNLAIVASRTDQTDQNLQAVCNLLGARARIMRNRVLSGVAAASIALGFGVAGWTLGIQEAPEARVSADAVLPALASAAEALPTPIPAEETPNVEAPSTPATEAPAEAAVATVAVEATYVRNHTPHKDRTKGPAWHSGRCTYDKPSDFIGYWYAGDASPGAVGQTVTVEIGVNVRADYPDVHNNFDKRTKVRCILKRGDKVKLTAAPILVPGDRFWVPLYHGDLIEEAPEENLVAVR
jgi:hypothetical protein